MDNKIVKTISAIIYVFCIVMLLLPTSSRQPLPPSTITSRDLSRVITIDTSGHRRVYYNTQPRVLDYEFSEPTDSFSFSYSPDMQHVITSYQSFSSTIAFRLYYRGEIRRVVLNSDFLGSLSVSASARWRVWEFTNEYLILTIDTLDGNKAIVFSMDTYEIIDILSYEELGESYQQLNLPIESINSSEIIEQINYNLERRRRNNIISMGVIGVLSVLLIIVNVTNKSKGTKLPNQQ